MRSLVVPILLAYGCTACATSRSPAGGVFAIAAAGAAGTSAAILLSDVENYPEDSDKTSAVALGVGMASVAVLGLILAGDLLSPDDGKVEKQLACQRKKMVYLLGDRCVCPDWDMLVRDGKCVPPNQPTLDETAFH